MKKYLYFITIFILLSSTVSATSSDNVANDKNDLLKKFMEEEYGSDYVEQIENRGVNELVMKQTISGFSTGILDVATLGISHVIYELYIKDPNKIPYEELLGYESSKELRESKQLQIDIATYLGWFIGGAIDLFVITLLWRFFKKHKKNKK